MAFEHHEPWDEPALDFWMSRLLALVANLFRGSDQKAIEPLDLLPEFLRKRLEAVEDEQEAPEQDWRGFQQALKLWFMGAAPKKDFKSKREARGEPAAKEPSGQTEEASGQVG